ncbi:endopeptidase La [Qiania dongpingensis]|uniref:Lon protease n=1 Tax=Qiania dongpingensis TaxID=2763669 RepID=A0A7G9G1Q1_9FIRM|nr:endopeptidase La [Qiania dongpingensis]QNM04733.1 endopeptidase La [Qiania dongpingensis]
MTIPAIALRGLCVLPKMVVHFDVSRRKSILALEKAMVGDQKIFLVAQKSVQDEDPGKEELYSIGTIGMIKQILKLPGGMVRVLVEGLERAQLSALEAEEGYLEADVEVCPPEPFLEADDVTKEAMCRILKEHVEKYAAVNPALSKDVATMLLESRTLEELLDEISISIPFSMENKQQLIETTSLPERYVLVEQILGTEVEISRIKQEFQEKVKERIDKNQKEYILREQMKLIKEELGEDTIQADAEQFERQLEKLKAGKEVKERISKEIGRYKTMPMGSQEAYVSRNYIETLLGLPWSRMSRDNKDLARAEKILEEDHYGLEKVKERVMEFLAVRSLTGKGDSPIICLVGPPGTGKTSIARSVARALGKRYVRICLGGIRDEAEIRGHRRTYVGAMPGRVAAALKQAGASNPLMLLDEVDKVGSDYKGDPASALLEILDSAQNDTFRDHYIELPLDLSNVLFIATANTTQTIPRPLLDRMEIIEVSSYTENEKYHIADKYLVVKQMKKNGLTADQFSVSAKAVRKIIHNYTREAGVRELERKIGELCRKAAKELLDGKKKQVKITEGNLEKYLGKELVRFETVNEEDAVGIVRGLAWTSVGGDTLEVEVNLMPGSGKLHLTGQMGDVMKESAEAALSYVRSVSPAYQVDSAVYEKNDIHVHIPEGAVPKDGPSAGITMATAMLSAVTNKKVKADLAMTGEITLRGRVLPIGGLKEKLLAAKMADIHTVLVPGNNKPHVQELSSEILDGMDIKFVGSMDEVLKEALV